MELKENQDLLQAVFDSASNGIAVMQSIYNEKGRVKDFSILLFNAYTLKWIGNAEYKGKLYAEVFPMVKETGILDKFIEVAETGVADAFERWYTGEGMRHWFRFTAVRQGELLVVTTEDITQRKQAEIALGKALDAAEKQQRLYNSVTNNTPDLVYVFDLAYRFTYANKALLTMWGKPAEDAIGKGLRENGYEEWHAQMHEREIDEVVATKKSIRGTVSFHHAELGKRVYDYIFLPVFDEQGEVEAIAGTTRDITDIKRAGEAIMESESRFRNLIEESTVAAAVLEGPEWVLTLANNRMLDIWQRDSSIINTKLLDFMPEMINQPFPALLKTVYNTGGTYSEEDALVVLNRGGKLEEVYMDFSYKALRNSDGEVYAILVAAADVTERFRTKQQLKESEQRFQNLVREATVGIIVLTGAEMKVEIVNEAYSKLIHRKAEELLGKELFRIIPETEEYFRPIIDSVRNSGEELYLYGTPYFVWVDEQKTEGFLNLIYQPYREADGTVSGVMVLCQDVTAQMQAQQKLEESEARFRTLANDMPAFMFTADAETNLDFVNRQWLNFAGLTSEKGLGKAWETMTHPNDVEPMYAIYSDAVKTLNPYQFEIRQRRADGAYRWVLWNGIPRKTVDGKFAGMMGVGLDITTQKEVQEIIKESEEKFRKLADLVPQIIWTGKPDGFIDYYNKRWYEYTGFEEKEFGDESWIPILHPDDVPMVTDFWYRSVQKGTPYELEFRLKNENTGEYRWFLSKALPVKDKAGTITKWFGTCTDIHEQKTVTEKLESLVAERTKELQRSNEDLQQFAHVASHDLKEPVRKIKIFAGMLEQYLNGRLDETGTLFIEKIHVAADRMHAMIDGVLTYASTNTGNQIPEDIDLNDTVKSIENDLEVALQKTGAAIHYNHLPTLKGAPVLFYQLFYNLINNSIKFAKDGVPLQIKIASEVFVEDNKYFNRITFQDNGIGFEPQYSQRIFETFTRLNSKDKYEGTGLGLSLCKKIVERHGGSIIANGTKGEGATFTITLPMKQKPAEI